MANSKLLKEAIADAKAVKETALANAKLALEEAFTPRLQSILTQKLRQEAEEEGEEEMQNEELDSSDIGTGDSMGKTPGKQPALDADTDLSVGVKKSSANSSTAVSDYKKTKDINEEEEMGMEDEKDQEIAELRARLAELEGGMGDEEAPETEEEGMYGEEEGDEMEMGDDGEDYEITGDEEEDTEEDDMDLESIIRELEAQMGEEPAEEETEEEPTMEGYSDGAEAGTDKGEDPKVVMTTEGEDEKEDVIDLEEILREMEADMKNEEEAHNPAKAGEDGSLKAETLKKELNEAYNTIKSLRSTINEVNLLNAKLLFANKLFRAHNMTNEQKVKVIETLDRTKSVREVKLVYATLAENLKPAVSNKTAKKSISEGLASKVVKSTKPAVAQKQVIAESTDFANRFRKLAGIIK